MDDIKKVIPGEDYINHLDDGDKYELRDKSIPVLTHRAIEKLARVYGVTVHKYDWLKTNIQDQLVMVEVTGFWDDGRITPELGEANSDSLDTPIARKYPHSVAWKRGYDRAVIKHLGIEAYSEEESSDFRKGGYNSNPLPTSTKQPESTQDRQSQPPARGGGGGGGSGEPIGQAQIKGIQTTIKIVNMKGGDISEESIIGELFPGKTSLYDLTYEEGAEVIKKCNEILSKI